MPARTVAGRRSKPSRLRVGGPGDVIKRLMTADRILERVVFALAPTQTLHPWRTS